MAFKPKQDLDLDIKKFFFEFLKDEEGAQELVEIFNSKPEWKNL
jgi:hypothetical protein